MLPKKTPTSSLSGSLPHKFTSHHLTVATAIAPELLVKRVWYRTRTRIRRILSGGTPPDTRVTTPSPIKIFPWEIIEMIVDQLIYDLPTLRSCSLTCYSWYIAAVPYLHSTLIVSKSCVGDKPMSLYPILYKHMLGLLPLVKAVRILRCGSRGFSSKPLNCVLREFRTLSNVQTLEINTLNIPSFMPRIRRYFASFLPTLRSLNLTEPMGSNRQIVFFIGLFQHLEDLTVAHLWFTIRGGASFRRWFTFLGRSDSVLWNFMEPVKHSSCCVLAQKRCRCYNCTQTIIMVSIDTESRTISPANSFIALSSLADFDLSWNKSLRNLEISAYSLDFASQDGSLETGSRLLKYALLTIESPTFSQVDLLFPEIDLHHLFGSGHWYEGASQHRFRFELLRKIHKVRDFRLVLHAVVWWSGDSLVRELKDAVAAEKAAGGFDDLFPEPLVTFIQGRTSLLPPNAYPWPL
jgi:hypothetical protein